MSNQFTNISHVTPSTIHLVIGYVKENQKLLPRSPYYNIGSLIRNIIIIYYFIDEYFEKCPSQCEIGEKDKRILSKRGKEFEKSQGYNNVSYGHRWIPSNSDCVYKWTIKVLENEQENRNTGIMIGIVAKEVDVGTRSIWKCKSAQPVYFWCWSHIYGDQSNIGCPITYNYHKNIFFGKKGDRLIMELDLKQHSLKFWHNGKYCGVAIENMIEKSDQIKYKLAISMYWPGTQVQIQKFECISNTKMSTK